MILKQNPISFQRVAKAAMFIAQYPAGFPDSFGRPVQTPKQNEPNRRLTHVLV